ncbi:MAG: CBASS oligonucleotide cyclase [Planctomycetota bacterium]
MGGSGGSGGYFGDSTPQHVADKIREAEEASADRLLAAEVDSLLQEILADANDRDTDTINSYLDDIMAALEAESDDMVHLNFGGSVSKHTYVDGLSDVDALLVLNGTNLADADPAAACETLLQRLRERLPHDVEPDGFAITIRFPDADIQVVPALSDGDSYLLPSADQTSWSRTRPQAFAKVLTHTNRACNGKVVPTIKLVKVLLSSLAERRRPTGYHLENLAVEAFAGYDGPKTPRAMLHHFFDKAPALIREPIADRSMQSVYVDQDLGPANSTRRLMVADAVDRVGRRLRNADGSKDVNRWRQMFGVEG